MPRARNRSSLAILMGLIGVLATGLGGMRNGSAMAKKWIWTATLLTMFVGLLGALVRRGEGAWVGFALFGWAYALLAFDPGIIPSYYQRLVFADAVEGIVPRLHPIPGPRPMLPSLNPQFVLARRPAIHPDRLIAGGSRRVGTAHLGSIPDGGRCPPYTI
jgi:hypothetical protein